VKNVAQQKMWGVMKMEGFFVPIVCLKCSAKKIWQEKNGISNPNHDPGVAPEQKQRFNRQIKQ